MATKAQLAAEIMEKSALLSAPAPAPAQIVRLQRTQRRLERLPKAELEAQHAEYFRVSPDTEALADLVSEALEDFVVIISISRDTVRVEQPIAEMCPERVAGFDAVVKTLTAAGFNFNSGGCTCFLSARDA